MPLNLNGANPFPVYHWECAVPTNWVIVFNRIFKIIDTPRPSTFYYSGPRFIQKIQEIREDFPNYTEFLKTREAHNASTTRRDYFKDIFLGLDDEEKASVALKILNDVEGLGHPPCTEIRGLVSGVAGAPSAKIPVDAWNADRLQRFIDDMDVALGQKNPERVLTLAYTCLEGFFKAFVRKNIPAMVKENEITALGKLVKDYLKDKNTGYPSEIFNVLGQTAHAINRVRDAFSESHFGQEAELWVAIYIRDLVNTHIRLLLHFM